MHAVFDVNTKEQIRHSKYDVPSQIPRSKFTAKGISSNLLKTIAKSAKHPLLQGPQTHRKKINSLSVAYNTHNPTQEAHPHEDSPALNLRHPHSRVPPPPPRKEPHEPAPELLSAYIPRVAREANSLQVGKPRDERPRDLPTAQPLRRISQTKELDTSDADPSGPPTSHIDHKGTARLRSNKPVQAAVPKDADAATVPELHLGRRRKGFVAALAVDRQGEWAGQAPGEWAAVADAVRGQVDALAVREGPAPDAQAELGWEGGEAVEVLVGEGYGRVNELVLEESKAGCGAGVGSVGGGCELGC
ncbi:hypothetical protein BP5796_02396 [Coleophoma crateriformis]|uniref:Uncharacterized protein n=1 Tax=Coleophoma crateriformis TaxID=565419 RepID=A0A3D8SYI0_9HELO|nr:hypothetical protein BP5796_02396 [Coleophoma crateriformis]